MLRVLYFAILKQTARNGVRGNNVVGNNVVIHGHLSLAQLSIGS